MRYAQNKKKNPKYFFSFLLFVSNVCICVYDWMQLIACFTNAVYIQIEWKRYMNCYFIFLHIGLSDVCEVDIFFFLFRKILDTKINGVHFGECAMQCPWAFLMCWRFVKKLNITRRPKSKDQTIYESEYKRKLEKLRPRLRRTYFTLSWVKNIWVKIFFTSVTLNEKENKKGMKWIFFCCCSHMFSWCCTVDATKYKLKYVQISIEDWIEHMVYIQTNRHWKTLTCYDVDSIELR